MANDYWFPWYPRHYERDAGHLDHVSNSCYRRLIDAYMEGGEPIKKDPIRLMAIMRASPSEFAAVWPQIEGFFTVVNGYLHLRRCNIELDRQDARRRFASEAGKRSAKKRSKQYQLSINDRSTVVQRSFNDPRNDRTGQDITIEIDSSAASKIHSVVSETLTPPTQEPKLKSEVSNGRGKRGSRIDPDWRPSESDIAFAAEHGIVNGAVVELADEFRDYWIAATGKNAIKLDWSATWRNRVRFAAKGRHSNGGGHSGSSGRSTGSLVSAMRNVMSGKAGNSGD